MALERLRYICDPSSKIIGAVNIGDGSVVEPSVILGHPSAKEVAQNLTSIDKFHSVVEFYGAVANAPLTIEDHAIIRSGSVIYNGTRIGRNFDCGHNVIIRENVEIGDDVYVKNGTEIMSGVIIGTGCRIAGIIADNAILGRYVSSFGILTHRYGVYLKPRKAGIPSNEPPLQAPTVCDRAIIGRGAVIVGARRIGKGAVIGPNVVVNFDVEDGEHVTLDSSGAVSRRAPD